MTVSVHFNHQSYGSNINCACISQYNRTIHIYMSHLVLKQFKKIQVDVSKCTFVSV